MGGEVNGLLYLLMYEFFVYFNKAHKRKLLYLRKRAELERIRSRNKVLMATWMKKRIRHRSCWVLPELLNPAHGKFWEVTVPEYSGRYTLINKLLF